jgi:hypothetical protein
MVLDRLLDSRRIAGARLQCFFRKQAWSRCYDFLNIFAEKLGEKIGVFDSKQS